MVVSPYKIEKYYQDNIDRFMVGDQVKLRMIYIKRGEPVAADTVANGQDSTSVTNQPAPTNSEAAVAVTNSEAPAAVSTSVVSGAATAMTNTAEVATTNTTASTAGGETNVAATAATTATTVPPAVDLQRKLAEEILGKLDAGDSFESLARVYSEGKEAKEGGDWGWIGRDILRKELNQIAFSLKPGQHSRVIETVEGYYILEVDDVKPAHTTPLAEVRDDIEKILLQRQRAQAEEQWVKDLRAKAYIRLF
jgi:hypothetical protein